jgi:hypothetical protein
MDDEPFGREKNWDGVIIKTVCEPNDERLSGVTTNL